MKQRLFSRLLSRSHLKNQSLLEALVFRAMVVFLVIALWTFFGRIFRDTQPWFSLLLGGAGVLWTISYSRQLLLGAMGKKKLSSATRKHHYEQLITSATVIGVAVGVVLYNGPILRWIALGSLLTGLLISWTALVFLARPGRISSPISPPGTQVSQEPADEELTPLENPLADVERIQSTFFVGILYFAVCLPLAIWLAIEKGFDPIDVVLLADFRGFLPDAQLLENLSHFVSLENLPTLFAMGAIYGASGIAGAFVVASVHRKGWVVLVVSSNGLLLGYVLTMLVAYLLGLTPRLIHVSQLSLAYIFLIAYLGDFVVELVARWGMREKYEFLIQGISGVATAWVVSRVFGESSVVFSGILFFVCTFATTTACEVGITKLIKFFLGGVPKELSQPKKFDLRLLLKKPSSWAITVAVITAILPLIALLLITAVAKGI